MKISKIETSAIVTKLGFSFNGELILHEFFFCREFFFSNFLVTEQEKKGIEKYKSNIGDMRGKYSNGKHAAFVFLILKVQK